VFGCKGCVSKHTTVSLTGCVVGIYTAAMNRDIIPFSLRLPAELRKRLEEEGAKNIRSLNAEVVARLECSLAVEKKGLAEYSVGELVDELLSRNVPLLLTVNVKGDGQ